MEKIVAEHKVQVQGKDGKTYEAMEVPIKESLERWSETILEDGTVIRAKLTIASIARIEGEYDQQGNPVYSVNSSPIVAVINVPEHLKKKGEVKAT